MQCPHCQAELCDPPPRFCEGCGLATGFAPRPAAAAARRTADDEPPRLRCPECGMPATARRCRGCGARVRWPDDLTPPDEKV